MLPDQFTDKQIQRGALTSAYKHGYIHAQQGYDYVKPIGDEQFCRHYANGYVDGIAALTKAIVKQHV